MVLGWLFSGARRRRRRILRKPMPAEWRAIAGKLPFFARLDPAAQIKLCNDLRIFIAEKEWEGCAGLEVTDEMCVVIAAQACLLVLHLDHDFYPSVRTILIYPRAYRTGTLHNEGGIVTEGANASGEAWAGGPVVLTWDATARGVRDPDDGHNVVYHEFAHKLDMQDGLTDGTPRLRSRKALQQWVAVMTREFEALRTAAGKGQITLLDHYGATNVAEFFAVVTECFFERSREMRARHQDLYRVLSDYYRQDPAARERRYRARERTA